MSFLIVLLSLLCGILIRASIVYWIWGYLAVQLDLPRLEMAHSIAFVVLVQVLTRYTPPGTVKAIIQERK